jgi:glucokinase
VFLAGDIGGTHARLALLAPDGRVVRHDELSSRKFPTLEAALSEFLAGHTPRPKLARVALGVAGPVVNGRCVATNLPWIVDGRVIARKLKAKEVVLLNDLVALSLGAVGVPRSKLRVLNDAGYPKKGRGNVAVIAAGTGLGEAMLLWDGKRFLPNATEGGHTSFAPSDDLEVELLQFLRSRFGHVSWERVLSGGGLGNIYDFFVQAKGITETPENAQALSTTGDRNAAISSLGLDRKSDPASRSVELFTKIYGGEAGNLALKTMALGGVYVCGNITERMLPVIQRGGFELAFRAKGRFAPFMEKIPVVAVLDSSVGLKGAESVALRKSR